MWYAKVPKFPEFLNVKNGVCEALLFSTSVQDLGMRLPVNTFAHVLAVMLCTCSSPAPQYCILQCLRRPQSYEVVVARHCICTHVHGWWHLGRCNPSKLLWQWVVWWSNLNYPDSVSLNLLVTYMFLPEGVQIIISTQSFSLITASLFDSSITLHLCAWRWFP